MEMDLSQKSQIPGGVEIEQGQIFMIGLLAEVHRV